MYRVLIVDDEEPVLNSFSFMIEEKTEDFEVCGTARSGEEAIGIVVREEPDLVFMDVQMPGIDGIETIRRIRDNYPDIVFILATAYERFDIARKVIPLNVFSYLVKPVSKKNLLEELGRVKQHLDRLKEKGRLLEKHSALLKESRGDDIGNFISGLMLRNPSEESWKNFQSITSMGSDTACIGLFRLNKTTGRNERETIYRTMVEKIQFKYNCRYSIQAGMMILLIPCKNRGQIQEDFIRKITDKHDSIFALGEAHHYSEMMDSFLGAFEEIQEAGGPDVHKETRMLTELVDRIIRADTASGETHTEALVVFEAAWPQIFATYSFEVAKAKMVALFSLLLARSNLNVFSLSDMFVSPAEEIVPLKNIEEWERWYPRTLSLVLGFIHENQERELPAALLEAMDYVRANFNKPLQLSDIADHCRISSGYLSRQFSQHLGIRFVDYLNQYRIQQAQVLLGEKRKSVKEIAWEVGFQDPNYFSRLFRRYTGVSPRDHE